MSQLSSLSKLSLCPQHFPSRRVALPIVILSCTFLLLSRIVTVEPGFTPAGDFRLRLLWAFSSAPSASVEFTQSPTCSSARDDTLPRVEESALVAGLDKVFGRRPRKKLPEEIAEQECIDWWHAYAAYHRAVLRYNGTGGWPAPRLAVVKKGRGVLGDGGGLGDTVSSQVSSLVFALLSGRVFQVYWTKAHFVFENLYIDTSYTGPEHYLDLTPDKEQGGMAESEDGKAQSSCVQVPGRPEAGAVLPHFPIATPVLHLLSSPLYSSHSTLYGCFLASVFLCNCPTCLCLTFYACFQARNLEILSQFPATMSLGSCKNESL
jgi:hypothetical protein